jgi:hypothetical protein
VGGCPPTWGEGSSSHPHKGFSVSTHLYACADAVEFAEAVPPRVLNIWGAAPHMHCEQPDAALLGAFKHSTAQHSSAHHITSEHKAAHSNGIRMSDYNAVHDRHCMPIDLYSA